MRKYFHCLMADCSDGLYTLRFWYIWVILLFVLVEFAFTLRVAAADVLFLPNLADRCAALFAGMRPYSFGIGEPFSLPIEWFVVVLASAYTTLWYPFRSLRGMGTQLIVQCGSKAAWWFAKATWVCLNTVLFWLIGYCVALLFTVAENGSLSLFLSNEFVNVYGFGTYVPAVNSREFLLAFLSIPLVAVAVSEMQMLFSLLVNPVVSFGMTACLLFMSAYATDGIFIGNFLMAIRSDAILPGCFSPIEGMRTSFLLSLFAVFAGEYVFSRFDLLDRRFDL